MRRIYVILSLVNHWSHLACLVSERSTQHSALLSVLTQSFEPGGLPSNCNTRCFCFGLGFVVAKEEDRHDKQHAYSDGAVGYVEYGEGVDYASKVGTQRIDLDEIPYIAQAQPVTEVAYGPTQHEAQCHHKHEVAAAHPRGREHESRDDSDCCYAQHARAALEQAECRAGVLGVAQPHDAFYDGADVVADHVGADPGFGQLVEGEHNRGHHHHQD